MEFIKKEYKSLLIIFVLFLVNLLLFKDKMLELYMDFGKEIYFAKAIAQGGVLYRDVLALFGPFAYLLNAVFVKIFGAYIRTFYLAGAVNALLILTGIYALSREFLSRISSFALAIFVLYFCCFVPHVMNYITPYSYAVVYGLCAALFSVLLFVKYLKNTDTRLLYAGMLLAGIAASCKYEFVFLIFVMLAFLFVKKVQLMQLVKSLACYFVVPVICLCVLFLQGLSFKELVDYLFIWLNFASSADIKEYYTGYCYFSWKYFSFALKSFGVVVIALSGLYYIIKGLDSLSQKIQFKYSDLVLYVLLPAVLAILSFKYDILIINFVFCSAAMVLAVLAVIKLCPIVLRVCISKREGSETSSLAELVYTLPKNMPVFFLIASALVVSMKVFFFISVIQYGRYFLPLILLALIVVLKKYYFNKNEIQEKLFEKTVVCFLVFMSILSFASNIKTLKMLNHKISSPFGTVYKDEASAKVFNTILTTVNEYTKPQDTVVVLQEGLLINFLSGRKADKYNYLIPALLNLYGENNVVKHFSEVKPEMFIILTSPDDKALICNGWGYGICGYVSRNYRLVQEITADKLILIFKKI